MGFVCLVPQTHGSMIGSEGDGMHVEHFARGRARA